MSLNSGEAAVIKGMILRGDRQHDIAAHFGVNAGRIAEVASGAKFSDVRAAAIGSLPNRKMPRYIDPRADQEAQYTQLMEFIKNPPETSRVLVITPELAALVLDRLNQGNRRKRTQNIARFARSMTEGEWILTGVPLIFSRRSVLLDGQNRLAASIRAQTAFKTHVVFGIDEQAFLAIDNGAKRTAPDTFECAAIPYHAIVGPAVRWLMIRAGNSDRGKNFENREMIDYFNREVDSDLIQWAARSSLGVSKIIPRGAVAAHLYLFAKKSRKQADDFGKQLAERRGHGKVLLTKIGKLREQNLGRMHEDQVNAFLILAWNALRENKPLTVSSLKWTTDQETPAIA